MICVLWRLRQTRADRGPCEDPGKGRPLASRGERAQRKLDILISSLLASRILRKRISVVETTQHAALCYGSPSKLTYSPTTDQPGIGTNGKTCRMWSLGLVFFVVKLVCNCQMRLVFITESNLNAAGPAGDTVKGELVWWQCWRRYKSFPVWTPQSSACSINPIHSA